MLEQEYLYWLRPKRIDDFETVDDILEWFSQKELEWRVGHDFDQKRATWALSVTIKLWRERRKKLRSS